MRVVQALDWFKDDRANEPSLIIFSHPKLVDRSMAIDSLRKTLATRKATPAQIAEAAKSGRVWKTVQPYLEAMTSDG